MQGVLTPFRAAGLLMLAAVLSGCASTAQQHAASGSEGGSKESLLLGHVHTREGLHVPPSVMAHWRSLDPQQAMLLLRTCAGGGEPAYRLEFYRGVPGALSSSVTQAADDLRARFLRTSGDLNPQARLEAAMRLEPPLTAAWPLRQAWVYAPSGLFSQPESTYFRFTDRKDVAAENPLAVSESSPESDDSAKAAVLGPLVVACPEDSHASNAAARELTFWAEYFSLEPGQAEDFGQERAPAGRKLAQVLTALQNVRTPDTMMVYRFSERQNVVAGQTSVWLLPAGRQLRVNLSNEAGSWKLGIFQENVRQPGSSANRQGALR